MGSATLHAPLRPERFLAYHISFHPGARGLPGLLFTFSKLFTTHL